MSASAAVSPSSSFFFVFLNLAFVSQMVSFLTGQTCLLRTRREMTERRDLEGCPLREIMMV